MSVSKKQYVFNLVFIVLFIAGTLFLNGNGGDVKAGTKEAYKNIEVFAEVLRQIEKNYVEPEDSQDLIYGAIKGMVRCLDPHSSFMTKDEYQELRMETSGSFTGVGIEITIKDDVLTVVSPIEGTPAYKAGIQAGDRIVKVDGKLTKNMPMMKAVKSIRGEKGTPVKLTIIRQGEEKPLDFSIMRDVIPLVSVRQHLLTPMIAYLRISNFQGKTTKDLISGLDELEKKSKLRGLILDLRNNPGGLLTQAVEVSDVFLESGVIVKTKGRRETENMVARAHKNRNPHSYPIIVLVNSGSASAAEIVAGALQDNKRAIILGTRTFGKGSVQVVLPLSDGSALRLTTARYYTPSGRSIQSSGIIPDIELEYSPLDEPEVNKKDHFLREENIEGHMSNEDSEDDEKSSKSSIVEKDDRVKMLLKKDNQVRHAMQLLQTWTIFSQIKTVPESEQ